MDFTVKTPSDVVNDKVISIENHKDQFLSCWYSIKRIIKEEIPPPAEIGFLMETMSELAAQVKDTTKEHKVKLTVKKWVGVWNCLNVCLNNQLYSGQGQQTMMLEMLSIVAVKVDGAVMGEVPPEELAQVESPALTHTKGGLGLVK